MKKTVALFMASAFALTYSTAQEKVSETFNSFKIVNANSTKTLKKREFRYIIEHRFGDIAGEMGGVQTGFGFDNAADIRFGFDFGLSDKWMVGIARSKGANQPYRSLLDASTKYLLLEQTKDLSVPVSMAITGTMYYTYQQATDDLTQVNSFPTRVDRFAYASQLIVTHKLNERLSFAVLPTYVYRNYVLAKDNNMLFSVGGAANLKLTKSLGIIAEYFYGIGNTVARDASNTNSLGFALEWKTNGHCFHFNFTNARGMGELQYIANTESQWTEGEFRFGFGISRTFKY
ncbi:hypothetical protein SAMN05216474_2316 [Lishizhenia tianjinensis]|uniref:DUF5777 domain-containing protein n=1 Tax=Lishizhenia tianjinensis TaxID=477690 RepID=A0A1I7AQK5_9FLAO|nr:DUF5777 family beta-barrel protein [Lishizhenia tianjinensis]SFT77239.1 hypothetical protein SAMN05216474_2316 [Lishizhenia tianjinensis]